MVWDTKKQVPLEIMPGHDNSVTSLAFCNSNLYTSSLDHNIICWDMEEINERIQEKQEMAAVDRHSMHFWYYLDIT